MFANNRNRCSLSGLCLSQDGACTDSFENFRDNSLKGGLSNNITLNPPLFSLVNTFKENPLCLQLCPRFRRSSGRIHTYTVYTTEARASRAGISAVTICVLCRQLLLNNFSRIFLQLGFSRHISFLSIFIAGTVLEYIHMVPDPNLWR